MIFKIYILLNIQAFNKFRQNFSKNLWQSIPWSYFQEKLKKQVFLFGDNEAIAVGIIQKMPFGLNYLEIPRGPIGTTESAFWQELKNTAKQYKCIFIRISPAHYVQNMPKIRLKAPVQIHPTDTLILDLTLSESELLKQMKPKGRYNIRVAQRHGVEIFESKNVKKFYELIKETTHRNNFSAHPLSYYQNMLESLKDYAKLYLAKIKDPYQGEIIIAGGIFIFMDNTCTYYYGASSHKYKHCMAPYLLQWQVISEAKKQNFKKYDFLGIAPENKKIHPLKGISRFKLQFGGSRVKSPPAQDIIFNPFLYLLYLLYKIF